MIVARMARDVDTRVSEDLNHVFRSLVVAVLLLLPGAAAPLPPPAPALAAE